MTSIDLTNQQIATLRTYLKSTLSDLSVEIAGTDRKAYRDEIKAERTALNEILARLPAVDT